MLCFIEKSITESSKRGGVYYIKLSNGSLAVEKSSWKKLNLDFYGSLSVAFSKIKYPSKINLFIMFCISSIMNLK